jgi:hypothetical protein
MTGERKSVQMNGRALMVAILVAVVSISTSVIVMGFWVVKAISSVDVKVEVLTERIENQGEDLEEIKARMIEHKKDHP